MDDYVKTLTAWSPESISNFLERQNINSIDKMLICMCLDKAEFLTNDKKEPGLLLALCMVRNELTPQKLAENTRDKINSLNIGSRDVESVQLSEVLSIEGVLTLLSFLHHAANFKSEKFISNYQKILEEIGIDKLFTN